MSILSNMLALNAAHETETGPVDTETLSAMLATAFLWREEGGGADGFLIAFDQDAAYDSPNFHWFRARYPRFAYVDRVIVAPHARGRGLARCFYDALAIAARKAGHERIVCEINLDPPNPGSAAFHDALGFAIVGEALLANGKTVSYRELTL